MTRECIVLCGFMGCGKSTVGRKLARLLHYDFLDLDAYIEEQAGCAIPEIFATQGEAAFRALETDALRLLSQRTGLVLASGGGALLRPENAAAVHQAGGRVAFLDCAFSSCFMRIKNSDRPIVRRSTRTELEALYAARLPAYRAACDVCVPASGKPGAVATAIAKALGLATD